MHHLVQIQAAVTPQTRPQTLAMVRAADDGRFRVTLNASLGSGATKNGEGQVAPMQNPTEGLQSPPSKAVANPIAAQAQAEQRLPVEVEQAESAKPTKVVADIVPRDQTPGESVTTKEPVPHPAIGATAQKKVGQRETGAKSPVTESSPQEPVSVTPAQVEDRPVAPTPVPMPSVVPEKQTAAQPDEPVDVRSVGGKSPEDRGVAVAVHGLQHRVMKPEAVLSKTAAEPKVDGEARPVPPGIASTPQDVLQPGNAMVPHADHSLPVGVAHAGSPVSATGVTRLSDAGEVNAPSSGGSPATDLKTLVATPNVLEVGIASGSHGWLRVRAEFGDGGGVAASVVTASASAAEGLHKDLPAISAYLAGERVGVSSLVVHATEKSSSQPDALSNNGTGGWTGHQSESDRRSKGSVSTPVSTLTGTRPDTIPTFDAEAGLAGLNVATTFNTTGSGNWLSVRV